MCYVLGSEFSGETSQMLACSGEATCKVLLHEERWRSLDVQPGTGKRQVWKHWLPGRLQRDDPLGYFFRIELGAVSGCRLIIGKILLTNGLL